MALIQAEDATLLKDLFAKELSDPVTLLVFSQAQSRIQVPSMMQLQQECQFCEETRSLAQEVADLSDKIQVVVKDFQADADEARRMGIDKIPALAVVGEKDYGIRFYGIPSGYEFSVLVEDIVRVSRKDSGLAQETRDHLKMLPQDVHIQVFVTPTCPYCPQAVRLAHQMAIESDRIRSDSIESIEFPHLANQYAVKGVPKSVFNNVSLEGAVPEPIFLQAVMTAAGAQPVSAK
jgi:glutaredoxin-like protein